MKIFTFAHKRPDFIPLQNRSFKRHVKGDFEFVVFNNAVFDRGREYDEINQVCKNESIRVFDVQMDAEICDHAAKLETNIGHQGAFTDGRYTNANVACAYPLCWAWRRIMSKANEPVLLLHSDVFLVGDLNPTEVLRETDMVFIPQARPNGVRYAWEAFVLIGQIPEPETMDWWCGSVNGQLVDVGGQTHHYFAAHPELRIKHIREKYQDYEGSIFHIDDKPVALHYFRGSNWNNKSKEYHRAKTEWLKGMLNESANR